MDDKELQNLEDLKVYSETAGGKYLLDTSKELCINLVDQIARSYKDKTHIELISLCGKLEANLSMYQLLTGIPEQIEAIKELFENKDKEE